MSCKKYKLGNLLEIQNGFAFNSKQFSGEGKIGLIRIRDLKQGLDTETRYSGEYDEKYIVKSGDYLIGMDGEFGCYEWKGKDALLNQRVCRLEKFSSSLDPRYLFYGINKYLKDIEDVTGFTTVKHISARQIREIEFPLPSIDEQKRIVEILDEAFAGIDQAIANTEQNLASACELFESYVDAIFSQNVENWERKSVSDVCELISGQHIDAKDYNTENKGIGYLTGPSDFGDVNPIISKWTEHPKRTAIKDDILITVKGSGIGKVNLMDADELVISRQLMAVRARGIQTTLLYVYLKSRLAYFQSLANGAAIPGISRSDVLNLEISVPPQEHQEILVSNFETLKLETTKLEKNYEKKLNALRELKQSLLQKAFSGELTANMAKDMAEAAE